jgi:hypothetical protein
MQIVDNLEKEVLDKETEIFIFANDKEKRKWQEERKKR